MAQNSQFSKLLDEFKNEMHQEIEMLCSTSVEEIRPALVLTYMIDQIATLRAQYETLQDQVETIAAIMSADINAQNKSKGGLLN